MTTKLVQLKDAESGHIEYLDHETGSVYADDGGRQLLRSMEPTDFILGDKGQPMRTADGRPMHVSELQKVALAHYYGQEARLAGKARTVRARDYDTGKLVAMDLGIGDVHTNATLPNYAAGYKIADGIADIAAPVVSVPKASDVYYTWNATSDFNRKLANAAAPGSGVAEVNPGLAPSTYTTVEYALGGFLPTEVQSNADAPLRPFSKMTQVIIDALRLEREIRVATMLQNSANWNSNLVTTIATGAQWDNGPASDPIANLHHAIEQSYLPVTGILWSELVEHDFVRNSQVQKFIAYKDPVTGLPSPQQISDQYNLPTIYTAKMKYLTNGGQLTYVWGNHVVLLHQPSEMPPTSQMDVATAYTMRWNGGTAPDGSMTGGFLVRTYYDPKRGARGGTQVVVVHNDAEQMTSGLVGGLLLNAHQ